MRTEIAALHRRIGAATIYVTHDQSEAMTMSDRVAVMMDGEILQVGSPEDVYVDPQDIRVAGFLGSPRINTIAVEIGDDGEARVGASRLGVFTAARGPRTLAVRPEDLSIAADGLPCRIEQLEFLGESLLLHARNDAGGEALIARLGAAERRGLQIGAAVTLRPDPARSILFGADGKRVPTMARAKVPAHG
jgi:multiple sugar transport system ATP-binding protein